MLRPIIRRRLETFVVIATLSLLWIGPTRPITAADGPDAFTILHLTDLHLCNLDGYTAQLAKRRDHFSRGFEPFRQLLDTVPDEVRADALAITGDMVDFHEGQAADGTLRAGQIEPLVALLANVRIPVWMTLGNHDIQTHVTDPQEVARFGGRPAMGLRAQVARAAWIRQCACFGQGTYYAQDVRVGDAHWRLSFLDNSYQSVADQVVVTDWGQAQLDWLNNELAQSPDQKALLFYHIPLNPREAMPADDGAPRGILRILDAHPCVVAAFCGHGHKNIVFDPITLPAGHAFVQIETAAFGYDRSAWRTLRLAEDSVTVSKPGSREVEVVIPAPATPKREAATSKP